MSLLLNLFCTIIAFSLCAVMLAGVLAYHKQIGDYLKSAGDFVGRLWKPVTIGTGAMILFALMWYLEARLTRNEFLLALLFVVVLVLVIVVLALVIRFRHCIGIRICKCWHKSDKTVVISTIFVPIVSVVGGLVVLGYQWQAQSEILKSQYKAEQFKNAIDQLGSEKQAVVLGSVHALHNLAMTYPKDYSKPVFEILCSFVREETRKDEYKTKETNAPSIVIQTIVDKLFREKIELDEIDKETGEKLQLYRAYKANLSGAFLQGTDLEEAKLREADLRDAKMQGAKLQGADLREAKLQRAIMDGANLQGAKLYNTIFNEDESPQPDDESTPEDETTA